MVQLTAFGSPDLCDDAGRRIDAILAQPRRLALLTYLAVETHKTRLRRDIVLGMFWPDVSQERASRSLSQALHFLRNHLGTGVLDTPGRGELRVNAQWLSCDVCRFLQAGEAGEHARAVQVYTGDFMRGFYVDGALDFEQWVEQQRGVFRRLAAESAMAAARHAAEQGHSGTTTAYARRAAELGLFAEPLVCEQMELLAAAGDYVGALDAYEQLRRRLRHELEVDPSPATEALADRLREYAATRTALIADSTPAAREATATSSLPSPRPVAPRRQLVGVAAVAVLVAATVLSLWGLSRPPAEDLAGSVPILIIDDFTELGSAPRGSGKAIVADMIGKLSIAPRLSVKHAATGAPAGHNTDGRSQPLKLTGYVSSGTAPNSYKVSVTLLEGNTGEGVAYRVFEYDSARFSAFGTVADEIAEFTRIEAGRYSRTEELTRLNPRHTNAIHVAQQYRVRGDSLRGEGQAVAAIDAFDVADSLIADLQDRKKPAATLLNERAELWLARAWVFLTPEAYDPAKFRVSASRSKLLADSAVLLDPASAAAHENAGVAAHFLWQTAPAESANIVRHLGSRARASLRESVRIAPARARAWALLSAVYYNAGEYADARVAAEHAYTANAYLDQSSDLLQRLVSASLETSDPGAAAHWCGEIDRRFADSWVAADCHLQLSAWSSANRADFAKANVVVANFKKKRTQLPQLVARLEMALGVVAARAGLPADSALAIQAVAIRRSPNDPELAPMRAWLWQNLNRPDSTRAVLQAYVEGDPVRRAGVTASRRFRTDSQTIASAR